MALLSDPTNESLAKRLIIHLEKKYSDYFWNQISESLTAMFDLTSISPEKKSREMSDQSSVKESYSALSPVFDLARGKRVIMQEKFLSPIIARFNTDSGSWSNPSMLLYFCKLIASLSFHFEEEILHVIYLANQLISLQASGSHIDLQKSLSESDLKNADPDPHLRLEKAMKAFASILLFKLKRVLRLSYKLDPEKCHRYVKVRNSSSNVPCEKGDFAKFFVEIEGMEKFLENLKVKVPSTPKEKKEYLQSITKVTVDLYALLENELEQDEDDFNDLTLFQNKRKRGGRSAKVEDDKTVTAKATPKRKGKRKSKASDHDEDEDEWEEGEKSGNEKKKRKGRRSRKMPSGNLSEGEEENGDDDVEWRPKKKVKV